MTQKHLIIVIYGNGFAEFMNCLAYPKVDRLITVDRNILAGSGIMLSHLVQAFQCPSHRPISIQI